MYHLHSRTLCRSTMSSTSILRKGLKFGGYGLPVATTPTSTQTPFLRSGVVSTNRWLSSSTTTTTTSSGGMITKRGFPRIPFLCLSPTYNGRIIPLFNPSDRCFYDIPIPKELQGPNNSVRGSGHGWLVMVKSNKEWDDDDEDTTEEMILSLYNPITRAHISLPCILPPSVVGNAHIWCNPTKASPGQPLMSIVYGLASRQILIYEQGDDDWSTEIVTPSGDGISSTVYHEAEATLYVVFKDGRLSALDVASSTLRPLIDTPSPEIKSLRYVPELVVGAAGDLLLVVGYWLQWTAPQFDVFKLDRRCLKWVRTESIGDQTLFVHDSHTVSMAPCDPSFTDAQASQMYLFKQYRTRHVHIRRKEETDNKITEEMPAEVQVLDLKVAAAGGVANSPVDQKERLFSTSNILRGGPYWYQQFAAWIVPSLS